MSLFWKNKPDKRLKSSTAFQLKKKKTFVYQNKMQEKITQQEKVGQKMKTAFHRRNIINGQQNTRKVA